MKASQPRLGSLAVLALAVATLGGCGVIKAREDRVVVANPAGQAGTSRNQAGGRDEDEEAIRQIKQFLDLYTRNGAMTREELSNFLEKYKAQIGPFLEGMHLSAQELIDLIFKLDEGRDGTITPREISAGLMKRFPILRWIPDNAAEIDRDELVREIGIEYPATSIAARTGLADTLMRFDRFWAQGDGNGKLSRAEVSGAGIILGVLAQTDFDKGFAIPPGVIQPVHGGTPGPGGGVVTIDVTPILGKMIRQKIDQQLFGRYKATSAKELPPEDLRAEWMQLGLKFFLSDKLVHHFMPGDGPTSGLLPESQAHAAFSAWGIPQLPHWAQLRGVYDNAMMGGDANGTYNSIEAFNYLTDLEFAQRVLRLLKGDFSSKAVAAHPSKVYLLQALLKLFPRTGAALLMNDTDPEDLKQWGIRREYWDRFASFDDRDYGGSEDHLIDAGETAMGLVHAKAIESLYELFDANHDTYLVRSEGDRLFAALGITDRRIVDAFYANIGLSTGSPTFWQKLKLFFSGPHGWNWLRPYDFHVRLIQVLPRLLEQDGHQGGGL